jgi:pyruvate dehydrogenase E2 component (dihydrolipoamide acetyltransferase)/2-oxoisovalerate dehydrogenase E2 component (dihydrolipoyl transacylase)
MEFRLPELGEGVYEAELVSWLVKPGDTVTRGQALMEVLTDKATMEVPAPFAGVVTKLDVEPGQVLKVGQAVLTFQTSEPVDISSAEGNGESPTAAAVQQVNRPPTERTALASAPGPRGVRAAPSVRYLARKLGIDMAQVRGSGPGGRILIDDLTPSLVRPSAVAQQPETRAAIELGQAGTRQKLQGVRRKIAEHMVLSARTIPHYAYIDECDVTEMVRLRKSLRGFYKSKGIDLTYLAFIVKAAALSIKEVPIVNATLDEQAGEILLHDYYHIGVATTTRNGLMVPVVRDADKKELGQIAREIEILSSSARSGKIKLEDLRGSTFTVTSIGSIGGLISTPIINYPEVAILGVGKIVTRPTFDEAGTVKPANMVYLSLSLDHRIVDGAVAAVFGNAIRRFLENPAQLLVA